MGSTITSLRVPINVPDYDALYYRPLSCRRDTLSVVDVTDMAVDVTELLELATRLRRQTTNRDVLALCDAVLVLAKPRQGCPVCAARRAADTERQRKWRRGVGLKPSA